MQNMRIINIYQKLSTRGLKWIIWRCRKEMINPVFPFIKKPMDFFLEIKSKLRGNQKSKSDDYLYAIFDLEISPITFNIGEFLCAAEIEAIRKNKKGIVLVIVPEKIKSLEFVSEYEKAIDRDSIKWRIENIVIQVAGLHEACAGINILPNRSDVQEVLTSHETYPVLHDGTNLRYADLSDLYASKPYDFKGLRATAQGKKYIKQYLSSMGIEKKIVTLVVRSSEYDKARNSNKEELSKFVHYLLSRGYHPIVVPDTDTAFENETFLNSQYIFRDCCWNVGLRLALYELSFVSIFGPGGAGAIMLFDSACPCILINAIVEESIVSTSEAYKKAGIKEGDQWSFLPRHQFVSYKKETVHNLITEFEWFIKNCLSYQHSS
jgi:hypothetical protein